MDLADQPRLRFANNPLQLVVAELRFPPVYSIDRAGGIAPLQDALSHDYPKASRPRPLDAPTGKFPAQSARIPRGGWRFASLDDAWTVVVTMQSIALECRAYSRYEEFRDRVQDAFARAVDLLQPMQADRFGLRYVDEITHPDAVTVTDWTRFLRQELLAPLLPSSVSATVHNAAQQITLVVPEGTIAIWHGYGPPRADAHPDDVRSIYFFEVDAYESTPQALDVEALMQLMTHFKRIAWNLFRSSITDELVEYLQPRPLE